MNLESLYTELYAALTGNAVLMAKVTGIFDGLAPESQAGPLHRDGGASGASRADDGRGGA